MLRKEIIIIIALIIIAMVRFFFFLPEKPLYDKALNEVVFVKGLVVSPIDERAFNERFLIKPENEKSKILVITKEKGNNISYGDMVEVKGTLTTPENFITDNGKEFNYTRYLANQDVYYIIKNSIIINSSPTNNNFLQRKLFDIRDAFMKSINKKIISPQSDLANGLILGSRGGFDEDLRNDFINTGTIHIVALSGYNISIVIENVLKILNTIFSKIVSSIVGAFVMILFILMTGAEATAIRAGIMASILLLAEVTGRRYLAGRALVIAAMLMLAFDLRTITDISFQLSFLATAGILFINPKVLRWFYFLPIRFKIRETVSTTVSATIAVLPNLLYTTGVFSLVSLPANVLVLPVIPIAMLFSFLSGIVGLISTSLAIPFSFIADVVLSYILVIVKFFGSLPFASLNIQSFPIILTFALYILIIWWVFKKDKKNI